MEAIPADTPVTTPVPETVATAVLLLLHMPPGVGSVKLVEEPPQIPNTPVMFPGCWLTVTVAVTVPAPTV